jgi:hypothetical protein
MHISPRACEIANYFMLIFESSFGITIYRRVGYMRTEAVGGLSLSRGTGPSVHIVFQLVKGGPAYERIRENDAAHESDRDSLHFREVHTQEYQSKKQPPHPRLKLLF